MSENKLLAIVIVAVVFGTTAGIAGGFLGMVVVGAVIAAIALSPERGEE